jgi:hypothetical protein
VRYRNGQHGTLSVKSGRCFQPVRSQKFITARNQRVVRPLRKSGGTVLRHLTSAVRAGIHARHRRCDPRLLPQSKRHRPSSSCPSAAGRRPRAETPPTSLELFRPAVLGHPTPLLDSLERRPCHRETRDRLRLAARGFSVVLALAAASSHGQAEDRRGDPRSDPTHGGREPRLGSPQDPRRASEAWPRRLGKERSPVFSANWSPCSTASSRPNMGDARSCTSTQRDTRPPSGLCSNCAKRFPKLLRIDTSSSTATRSLTAMSSRS